MKTEALKNYLYYVWYSWIIIALTIMTAYMAWTAVQHWTFTKSKLDKAVIIFVLSIYVFLVTLLLFGLFYD